MANSNPKSTIEETVLRKARKFVSQQPTSESGEKKQLDPGFTEVKIRKPRHFSSREEKYQVKSNVKSTKTANVQVSVKKKNKKRTKKNKKLVPKEKNPTVEGKHQREALSYLKLWEKHRDQWKFEKLKQVWLLKNALKTTIIDDKNFCILLEYIASMKGFSRSKASEEMQSFMNDFDKKFCPPSDAEEVQDSPNEKCEATDIDKVKYSRARQIVQMLTD